MIIILIIHNISVQAEPVDTNQVNGDCSKLLEHEEKDYEESSNETDKSVVEDLTVEYLKQIERKATDVFEDTLTIGNPNI